MASIIATEFVNPQGLIVESGLLLAARISAALTAGEAVEVSLAGMRGLSSSYFNVILGTLVEGFGLPAIENRVRFVFDSQAQQQTYRRSLDSFKRAVA